MKQLFKTNFSGAAKNTALLLLLSMLFSSCGLLIVGASAASDKIKKNKVAKKEAIAKKRFSPSKASGLGIVYDEPESLTFGSVRALKLILTITDSTGTKYPYEGGGEMVPWTDFNFVIQGGSVDTSGKLKVDKRLEKCPGGKLTFKAIYKGKAGIDTSFVVDLLSKKEIPVGFKGKKGGSGGSGQSGYSGKSGNYGNSSDNGCSDGTEGGSGGHGENGSEGPQITVYIKKMKFSNFDREVIVLKSINTTTNDTSIAYYELNKDAIAIFANGGDGGNGGSGGSGGQGGTWNGQSTSTSYNCKGGRGGDAGDGADGGNGGSLKVYIDPSAEMFSSRLKLNVDGGAAGRGGSAGQGAYGGKPYAQSPNGKPGKDGRKGQRGQSEIIKQKLGDEFFK
ncbi:MAG: hypothetical protein ACJ76F_01565 [Bacteroidia bacterium]